jgi:hypothetical protein
MLRTFSGSRQNLNSNSNTDLSRSRFAFKINSENLTRPEVYNDNWDTVMDLKYEGITIGEQS